MTPLGQFTWMDWCFFAVFSTGTLAVVAFVLMWRSRMDWGNPDHRHMVCAIIAGGALFGLGVLRMLWAHTAWFEELRLTIVTLVWLAFVSLAWSEWQRRAHR